MKAIIIGCGRVGSAIAVELDKAGWDVTAVDEKEDAIERLGTHWAGGFVQGSTPGLKGWAPDINFTSTMSSLDSFVTLGGSTYGDPSGPYLANLSLLPSGWPTGTWNGTPISPPATSIASHGVALGWSTLASDVKSRAISLAGFSERIDFEGTAATSTSGAWFAHLVVAGDGPFSVSMVSWHALWTRSGDGVLSSYGRADAQMNDTFTVPAPAAAATFALAGLARRRRGRIP